MKRLAAVAVSALFVVACSDDGGGGGGGTAQGEPAPEGIEGVQAFAIEDNSHVEGAIEYPSRPPVAGDHNPVWANCRFYDSPVPDENAVHSLEHGAVWIAFAEDLPQAEVDALAQLTAGSDHILAAPYPGLGSPLVLTAWNRQLEVDSGRDPRVLEFLETYLDGPTAPERDAACSGGAG